MKKRKVKVSVEIDPKREVVLVQKKPDYFGIAPRRYFSKWVDACRTLQPDQWQRAGKKPPKTLTHLRDIAQWTKEHKSEPIRISDMHTMQLVNAIKWCVKIADQELKSSLFNHFGTSRATLLAQVPQWRALLAEGKSRKLKMIGAAPYFAPWFEEAMLAIVGKVWEKKG